MTEPRPLDGRRLLLLGLNYAPEPVGIGPYTTGLADALAEAGAELTVVAGKAYYPQWRRYPGEGSGWTRQTRNGVTVHRCPHYIPAAPSGAKRLLHHLSFALSALVPALRAALKRPDAVIVIAPSLLSVPVGWLAAKIAGAKLWIHVQDLEVDGAFATGLMSSEGPLARTALAAEATLLKSADLVSTISPQMVARIVAKGVAPVRTVELRNWASDAFGPRAGGSEALREDWGLGDRHVALYSGNIANKQGIEIIIEAARLSAHRDDLMFVICGQGPNRERLAVLAEGLDNVQLHDLQPAERMGDLLSLASVHLLPQIAGAADLVLPSKLANMLGSGRPVVATALPGTGLAAEVEGVGCITPPGDAAAFAAAITELIDQPDRREALGEAAKVRAHDRWSKAALLAGAVRQAGRLR